MRCSNSLDEESAHSSRHRGAFTLIELLAVVAIFALMAALIVPNMEILQARTLREQAERLAGRLELARQRTIVTGTPHRVIIDLENGYYGLEWFGRREAEEPASAPEGDELLAAAGSSAQTPLSLAPPRHEKSIYQPIPGLFGRLDSLEPGLFFAGVETDQGFTDSGQTSVEFERDGTTDGTTITLENEDGAAVFLEVAPLAEAVRIVHAES